jgi:hypothetical protein
LCIISTVGVERKHNDARCISEIKFRIATAKAAFNKNHILFTIKSDFNLRHKQGVTVKTFKDTKNCIVISKENRTQRRS